MIWLPQIGERHREVYIEENGEGYQMVLLLRGYVLYTDQIWYAKLPQVTCFEMGRVGGGFRSRLKSGEDYFC